MAALDTLLESLPEYARDFRLNLKAVLTESSLGTPRALGTALACAAASRSLPLRDALQEAALEAGGEPLVEDALAAAALMGMNNVFYRFRHIMDTEAYRQTPARLRMNRMARPATTKADFECFALAVSAINNCEACMKAHEEGLRGHGFTEAQVLDAVRIAATVHGAAVALDDQA